MSTNPLNDISKVYLEQVAAVEEGVRPTPVDKPLDKAAFKKRRRSLAGKEKSAEARSRGHEGKEWYNSGRTYSPDEAKRGRAKLDDSERSTRHRSAIDPEGDDRLYSADKTKNPKKLRKQKAMGELGESSHLEPDMKKRREANEKAIEDMKKTKAHKDMVAAVRKKFDEALDPVGKEDSDVDNDGKKGTNADKYLMKRRKAIGKAISTQEGKEVKRWWDDDGDGKGYEEGEVSGKFKKKKVKESFSNWRQDLSEVMTDTEAEKKVTEKKVNNKIQINPKLDLGETVEELGGTLLEMVEIDEMDYILESVYDELLEEGYEEDDIEEAIEYSLTEAKVTMGHDTPSEKKRIGLMAAAKSRLSSLKKSAKQAVATGARKVAKGALGVARKMEGGDKKPQTAARKPSTYRGAGAGQKERVSSGSYTPPTKKKAEKPADPWEGSATTPPKSKTKTKKAAAPKAKAPAAPKRKRKSKLDDLIASVRSESVQINEMPYQVMGSPDGGKEKKIGKPVKSKKYADARASELADTHKATGGKYRSQYVENVEQIDEKTLTTAETKEKERLVKSMKSKASDFEKRYPGRGKEVMYATATKMAKRMAEQALEMQPKTQSTQKPDQQQKKLQQQADRMRQQEVQILQRKLQALRSAPKGTDPSITA